jgi:LPXTG-motif cell wall-anchored protein
MNTRRLFAIAGLLVAVTALTMGTQPAAAQYAGAGTATVSNPTPTPGGSTSITACCFQPGTTVTFTLDGGTVVGTAVAGSTGAATATVTIPAGTSVGAHTITAAGSNITDGTPLTVTADLTVVAGVVVTAAPAATGTLPKTGSSFTTLLLTGAGVGLVVVGGLVVLAGRRRRDALTAR